MIKIFYLIGAVVFTVLILLIAFENVQAYCTYLVIFFDEIDSNTSPTILIMGVALLGAIAGFFYTSLVHSLLKKEDDEDGGGGASELEDSDF